MRIVFIKSVCGSFGPVSAGTEMNVSDAFGADLIKDGLAKAWEAPAVAATEEEPAEEVSQEASEVKEVPAPPPPVSIIRVSEKKKRK